jgi:hypothetical protein
MTAHEKMTGLDSWLNQATRKLSNDSTVRVRSEIQEHYESAREAAMSNGATADEAERAALTALGDAKAANCQYRTVLLTSAEARLLREGNWEARAICSRPWLKWLLLAMPVVALFGAIAFFLKGASAAGSDLLAGGIGVGILFAAPFLLVYTTTRARVFRFVKWSVLLGILGFAFWPDTLKWSWLLFSSLWPVVWIEMMRSSIRRKLPVAQWPRQLYL